MKRKRYTDPQIVSRLMGHVTLNAGVSSYGLTQMVLLARELIPVLRSEIILLQYSDRLVDRSTSCFALVYFGTLPTPYFSPGEFAIEIQASVFLSRIFEVRRGPYRNTRDSWGERMSFVWLTSLGLFIYESLGMFRYRLLLALGGIPGPIQDNTKAAAFGYGEIATIGERNGAQLEVVVLAKADGGATFDAATLPDDAVVAHAHQLPLDRIMPVSQAEYEHAYRHWLGDPPVLIDRHSNELAHSLIAESTVGSLRSSSP